MIPGTSVKKQEKKLSRNPTEERDNSLRTDRIKLQGGRVFEKGRKEGTIKGKSNKHTRMASRGASRVGKRTSSLGRHRKKRDTGGLSGSFGQRKRGDMWIHWESGGSHKAFPNREKAMGGVSLGKKTRLQVERPPGQFKMPGQEAGKKSLEI